MSPEIQRALILAARICGIAALTIFAVIMPVAAEVGYCFVETEYEKEATGLGFAAAAVLGIAVCVTGIVLFCISIYKEYLE